MKKVDVILALTTGETAAWFFSGIAKELNLEIENLSLILAVLFPVLAVFGLWLCWLLGKKYIWIWQLAKYLLIGVLATILDLGILNGLILASGVATGVAYAIFKGISFIVATSAKYFGDKFWAFEKMERSNMGKEFGQFFFVTMIGLGLNVGIASFVVNGVDPQLGLSASAWGTVGGIAAAFGVMTWNFIGYKFFVFKK
ncbi:MAG: GtrA family protein [Candidatus Nealsonbacteria bacterium]